MPRLYRCHGRLSSSAHCAGCCFNLITALAPSTPESLGDTTAIAADVDGDGDLDIISGSYTEEAEFRPDSIAWYENLDGDGTFGARQLISTDFRGATTLQTGDLDGDGDVDLLAGAGDYGGDIAWFENTNSQGDFASPRRIANDNFVSVQIGDIDGDGDLDVLAGSFYDEITWHEQKVLGDVNDDGIFNSSDLVRVFQIGEYEDDLIGNSTFDDGDWNGDGDFTSADLVVAFQCGTYVANSRLPSTADDRSFSLDNTHGRWVREKLVDDMFAQQA